MNNVHTAMTGNGGSKYPAPVIPVTPSATINNMLNTRFNHGFDSPIKYGVAVYICMVFQAINTVYGYVNQKKTSRVAHVLDGRLRHRQLPPPHQILPYVPDPDDLFRTARFPCLLRLPSPRLRWSRSRRRWSRFLRQGGRQTRRCLHDATQIRPLRSRSLHRKQI